MNTRKLLTAILTAALLVSFPVMTALTASAAAIVLLPSDAGVEIVRPEGALGNFHINEEDFTLRQMRIADRVTWPLAAAPGTYRVTVSASKAGDDRELPFNYVIQSGDAVLLEAPILLSGEDQVLNSWDHYVDYVLGEIVIAAGMNTLTLTNVAGEIRETTNWPRIRSITLEPVGGAAPAQPGGEATPPPAPPAGGQQQAGTTPAAPQTFDPLALIVIAALVSAAAVMIIRKRAASKI